MQQRLTLSKITASSKSYDEHAGEVVFGGEVVESMLEGDAGPGEGDLDSRSTFSCCLLSTYFGFPFI